jgi:hypothetical protein
VGRTRPLQHFFRVQRLAGGAHGRSLIRAALFAARWRSRCRSRGGKPWRERPRCTRRTWPCSRPEGSLTPWLSLSLHVVRQSTFSGEKRRVFCASNCARLRLRSSGRAGPVRPEECWPQAGRLGARLPDQLLPWKRGSRALHSMSTCGRREVSTSGGGVMPSAITTTMLHLCSAPCKALRFAPPAHARGLRALTVPARR